MGLTINLQQACVRVLMQCWEFKDKHTLEPLFGIDPLDRYGSAVPLEARSQVHLVELVIHNLVSYPAAKGQPLLDLLGILRDKRDEADAQRKELNDLLKQVGFYLSSLASESERTAGQNGPKESETREFRAAIGNYELRDRGRTSVSDLETESGWIAQVYEDPGQWAFRVALAVFNGAPWDTCMEAALDLVTRLPSPTKLPATESSTSAAPETRRIGNPLLLLKNADGELQSMGAFRIVRIKEPQLARVVLDYVWDEYTRRDLLADWLSDLVVSNNPVKRIRAAVATGLLMLTNFDSIQRKLFSKWAHAEDDRSHRAAIGRALGVVAEEGTRLIEVRNLLKFWAAGADQSLRWAAARAYIYVGARCPIDEVIDQWRIIADAKEVQSQTVQLGIFSLLFLNPLHVSLLDAMEKFFFSVAEMPEVRKQVFAQGLIGFKEWAASNERSTDDQSAETDSDSRQTSAASFGLLMFIKLARILLPNDASALAWPPVLLTLLNSPEAPASYRRCLTEMFELMLLDPAAQPTALDLLRSWMDRVEYDFQYETQMHTLLDDLLAREAMQGDVRRLLASHLGLWSPRSHFQIHEAHPDLTHLRHVVLVVDASESALPFWIEIKSAALALGSAFSPQSEPQVYLLNNREAQTLISLADSDPKLSGDQTASCSLIAPVIRDLIARGQQIDALVLIGNGAVFDLADWVEHPLIDRWVLMRLGPDPMIDKAIKSVEEIVGDSLAVVYDRLCEPMRDRNHFPSPAPPIGILDGRWRIDRSGYPMILVEPLQRYLHLFPVTKVQFERFLEGAENQAKWSDAEYAEILKLNPRASYRATDQAKYEQLFLTGIKPVETKAFASWLGNEYEIPDEQQWLTCYDWLAQQPIVDPPPGLAEDALAVWEISRAGQSSRTMLDLSLMCEGVKEWVRVPGKLEQHGGLGCPTRRFNTLNRNPRKLVTVDITTGRLMAYGFRLLAR